MPAIDMNRVGMPEPQPPTAGPFQSEPTPSPDSPPAPTPYGSGPSRPPDVMVGGIMPIRSAASLIAEEQAKATEENAEPVVQGIAGLIRRCWDEARSNKEMTVERRMLSSLRQRRGEYEPDIRRMLQQQHSALIYMMLTSNKCRSAAAWLREALADMPWECEPTPVAEIEPNLQQSVFQEALSAATQSAQMGYIPTPSQIAGFMQATMNVAKAKVQDAAKQKAKAMTQKMKDQMVEGGFKKAMDEFIDDLVTFPAACIKGPIVRKRPALKYVQAPDGSGTSIEVEEEYGLTWERVDPFDLYPAPDAADVDDGYLIERHRLSRSTLADLRGVEGYSEASINAVLDAYGHGGLKNWLMVDSERAQIEDRNQSMNHHNPSELIEALQFWGSVQGKWLIEWGMDESEIDDPLKEYHVEAWLIGSWVIKATINPDPLHRKPYYKTSWENIPGCFWGNSVPDLCRDAQSVCNAAARALVNNMAISSGPQVMVNSSRLPAGDSITEMFPWKIWSYVDDGYGSVGSVQPIAFFQPGSNAQELMQIYQQFSLMADEYTGIPKYMTGDSATGGAGRTASGLSMLMSNAGKTIKGVISSVDAVLERAIERLYVYNMQYLDDDSVKGDLKVVAKGAMALIQKEQQQQRVNEVFQMVLQSPVLQQIVGTTGIAYLFRDVVERLAINPNEIVPPIEILKANEAMMQQQMMAAQQQVAAQEQQKQGQPQAGGDAAKPENKPQGRQLMDGNPASTPVNQQK